MEALPGCAGPLRIRATRTPLRPDTLLAYAAALPCSGCPFFMAGISNATAADSARSGWLFRASEIDVGIRRPRLAKSGIEIASAPKLPKIKRGFKAAIRGNVRLIKCACKSAHCTLFRSTQKDPNPKFVGFSLWHTDCGIALRHVIRLKQYRGGRGLGACSCHALLLHRYSTGRSACSHLGQGLSRS